MSNFAEFVTDFCEARTGRWTDKLGENDKYNEIEGEKTRLYKEVLDYLPENNKGLINMLDEAVGKMLMLYEEYFYKCGLKDGLDLIEFARNGNLFEGVSI